jgi:hypothetical protein
VGGRCKRPGSSSIQESAVFSAKERHPPLFSGRQAHASFPTHEVLTLRIHYFQSRDTSITYKICRFQHTRRMCNLFSDAQDTCSMSNKWSHLKVLRRDPPEERHRHHRPCRRPAASPLGSSLSQTSRPLSAPSVSVSLRFPSLHLRVPQAPSKAAPFLVAHKHSRSHAFAVFLLLSTLFTVTLPPSPSLPLHPFFSLESQSPCLPSLRVSLCGVLTANEQREDANTYKE